MKRIKKYFVYMLAGTMLMTGVFQQSKVETKAAEYWPSSVNVAAQAAIVMEEETGTILYEKNIDATYYPASITKIMTALLAIENCEMDEVVTFSHDSVYESEMGSSSISRDVGEQMTMEQCLYGMMLESANECAYAIGEHVADGDINVFVDMMNEKANELGCRNSHFNNPNGLPDLDHYVSAYDMALIARAAYQNPEFAQIVGTKAYTIPPTNKHDVDTLLNNHHAMLNYYKTNRYLYDYCLGGKTGYTSVANNTLVTYAKKDGMTLVCVVLNVEQPYGQYVDTRALFDYCFDNFSAYPVSENASLFENDGNKDVGLLSDNIDLIRVSDDGVVVLPKTANFAEAQATVVRSSSQGDDVVGRIEYTYVGRTVGGADLLFTSADAGSYPFHNIARENGGTDISFIRIDFKMIFLVLLAIALFAGLIFFIHSKSGKIRLFKYRHIDSRKKPKPQYKIIRSKRRRRRR